MTSKNQFENQLRESLQYGFINHKQYQDKLYSPKIVLNKRETGENVLTEIQEQLETCHTFTFNVAFITEDGIAMLKTQLADLSRKGVRGRLIISPYLDFNDPDVLRGLLKFDNIEVRMTKKEKNMHAKVYFFEKEQENVVIAGSSNLTGRALKLNYEWNVKLTSAHDGDYIYQTKQELDKLWEASDPLTFEVIEAYGRNRQPLVRSEINLLEETSSQPNYYAVQPNQMQTEAIKELAALRKQGAKRALVISATGTGKTYMSAFDVRQYQPDKFLFIVHREQILRQAEASFQKVIGFDPADSCIYKSGMDISDKKYIFATIQTLQRNDNMTQIAADAFDYILIDESHRAGASGYRKVLDYFTPDFYLGMTATPERTDDENIFELFDYNIAYEIRLQDALNEEMLTPFMYYGVTEMIDSDGYLVNEETDFSDLVTSKRVDHILDKIHYYESATQKTRGLMFCSRKAEAHELSKQLNGRGLKTRALSGDDSQAVRDEVVQELEQGQLDYIITVDIFNEGVDIPNVNQVVMLRNTESSIVFVQQLGRGLRKYPDKEFVTVIDFIGNYKNNYMIPMALFGDQSYNKDNYRKDLANRNQIDGITTVNFEEIAKKQIFDSIQNTKLSSMANLKKAYADLKQRIGRIPMLKDFVIHQSMEPQVIFDTRFRNHSEFIAYMEKERNYGFSYKEFAGQVLYFVTKELMNGKRPHELILMKMLIDQDQAVEKEAYCIELENYNVAYNQDILESVENVLELHFFKSTDQKKYGGDWFVVTSDSYTLNNQLKQLLADNAWFTELMVDAIEVGLMNSADFPAGYTTSPLKIGQKYSRKDVSRLMCWDSDGTSTMFGYSLNKQTVPIFVNYHKTDKTNAEIQYEDEFINQNILKWFTTSRRTLQSKTERKIIEHQEQGIDLHLFIKKSDLDDPDHYYLGQVDVIAGTPQQERVNGQNIVTMDLALRESVPYELFHYFINE